ncbi:MAG: hypothetical protein HC841_04300 [Verrucomicrobiae bacterium]|nr:hypothetical protein [Verrucomicrobiae bacterium]
MISARTMTLASLKLKKSFPSAFPFATSTISWCSSLPVLSPLTSVSGVVSLTRM